MKARSADWVLVVIVMSLGMAACQPSATGQGLRVLAAETFLADIAQNVAGDRVKIEALLPAGVDPHTFEPTPADTIQVAKADVLIVNGAGFEAFLERLLENAGGQRRVVEAAAGLTGRAPREGEVAESEAADPHEAGEGDPHFWLNPVHVIRYAENIRDGLSQADPAGAAIYNRNAAAYIARLKELDAWIAAQVEQIPPSRRLLVTNHESFGYFADRYGFTIVGTIVPGVSTGASPSAQQLARLVDHVKAAGVPAIFLETGSNPQLARQVAQETGIKVVTELFTHSMTPAGGVASTYIEMMRYNTQVIVDALR